MNAPLTHLLDACRDLQPADHTTRRQPTYLRVVVTARCNLSCSYCHMEGDPHATGEAFALDTDTLKRCLRVAARAGMHKIKLLGGEPLLRKDLPDVIRDLRRHAPHADLSVITAGVLPTRLLDDALQAGLDRVNVSMHGFSPQALAARFKGGPKGHTLRHAFMERVLEHGRPLKVNYVFSGDDDLDDLQHLLDWAAPRGVLVNVLDNLQTALGFVGVANALHQLRGAPDRIAVEHDPHSLDTQRWHWSDGLCVELKSSQLGLLAPWTACHTCPARPRCKEGIFALRLTHQGRLQPCMDRPDLGLDLPHLLRTQGDDAALHAWNTLWTAL